MAMEILEARWTSWTLKRLGGLSFLEPFNRAVLAVNQVGMPIDVRVVSCISIEIGRDATAFDNIYIYIYIFDC